MPRRILVLSASVGAGHTRAAEAVTLALQAQDPNAVVRNVDVLTLTGAVFRRVYSKAYMDLVQHAPHLVGMLYDASDKAADPKRAADRLRALVQRLSVRALSGLLDDEPWDMIVNTHFLAPELIARRARRGSFTTPQVTVVTDFDAHGLWVHEPTARYFAATPDASMALQAWGVDAARVQITGIPIHPNFTRPADRADCRARHALPTDRPVVLVLSGGVGVGPVEQLVRSIFGMTPGAHIVVVCGRNEALRQKLARLTPPKHLSATVLGFTTQMDELMAAADVVMSKPGGLTTSECLARGVPMAVVNPIPGQESRNSDFLLEHGAAIKINNLALAGWKLSGLLADPARLAGLRANASALGRPGAGAEVAAWVLGATASAM